MPVFNVHNLVHPALVTATFKLRIQKGPHDRFADLNTHGSGSQRQDVCVVMGSRVPRDEFVISTRGQDAWHFVADHR